MASRSVAPGTTPLQSEDRKSEAPTQKGERSDEKEQSALLYKIVVVGDAGIVFNCVLLNFPVGNMRFRNIQSLDCYNKQVS